MSLAAAYLVAWEYDRLVARIGFAGHDSNTHRYCYFAAGGFDGRLRLDCGT